jgi:chromosome partitioning protein
MKVISFVSQKGGAGKTTLVINCAVAASSVGNRVLILDVDKQKSAEIWYQKREVQQPILVVAGPSSLANAIDKARNIGINTVFIDTPGHDSPGTADAIKVSDLCVIPCRPASVDLNATKATVNTIQRLGKPFTFIITQAKARRKKLIGRGKIPNIRTVEAKTALQKRFGNDAKLVASGQITDLVTFPDAYDLGLGVTEYAQQSAAAEDVLDLWHWIEQLTGIASHDQKEKNIA